MGPPACIIYHPLDRHGVYNLVRGIVLGSGDTKKEAESLP